MKHFPALTLIELLIVMAIVAVVSVPGFIAVANVRSHQSLGTSAEVLANTIKKAHIFAREARDDASWGVVSKSLNEYSLVKKDGMGESNVESTRIEAPTQLNSTFSIWFRQDSGDTDVGTSIRLISGGQFVDILVNKSGIVEMK